MRATGRFNRQTNRGTLRCRSCGTRKQAANIERSSGTCQDGPFSCFELCGNENDHSDTNHEFHPEAVGGKVRNCPTCHPELEALYTLEGRKAFNTSHVRKIADRLSLEAKSPQQPAPAAEPRIVAECWTCRRVRVHVTGTAYPMVPYSFLSHPKATDKCRAAGHDVREVTRER